MSLLKTQTLILEKIKLLPVEKFRGLRYTATIMEQTKMTFEGGPRYSEKNSAEKCYLHRSTCLSIPITNSPWVFQFIRNRFFGWCSV